ncbi:hypothetical protein [Deinococcus hopiensis]|uniref:Uncharacterized protein n=1 Tax=Deinococcus hopiensis KR-140 TaxID=695939 RepID=A0A1W1V7E5_9DEIO|nr:hypothetical protein [Deinococcus hopiensis]SMB89225.1 hypothetical protein SAMN00790413_00318 [Deinococcus hopiensis KR-140]
MPILLGRWDPLHPTNITAAVQLGWAFTVYHRPHLPELLPSYSRFTAICPWPVWGWVAFLVTLGLLFTSRSSGWRMLAHAVSGIYFAAAGTAFAAGVGLTTAVTTHFILAAISTVLWARTVVYWQSERVWWRRLVSRPPRWLRWLAKVGEYGREREDG